MLLENKIKFKKFKKLSVKLKKSHHSSISKPHIKFTNLNIIDVLLKCLDSNRLVNKIKMVAIDTISKFIY